MIDPRYWLPHLRARRALVGYPRYTVPHPQSEAMLNTAGIIENFDYFMSVRLERLAAFRLWLHENFGVIAPLDDAGLHAVNAWVERHGGGLVPNVPAMSDAFSYYRPAWRGAFLGCNVMVDLAIFIGEYLIAQRPRLRWICPLDCPKGLKPEDVPDYGRPHIGGYVHPWRTNVFQMGMGELLTARKRSEIGHDLLTTERNVVIENCEQCLKMADAPDDGKPFIFRGRKMNASTTSVAVGSGFHSIGPSIVNAYPRRNFYWSCYDKPISGPGRTLPTLCSIR